MEFTVVCSHCGRNLVEAEMDWLENVLSIWGCSLCGEVLCGGCCNGKKHTCHAEVLCLSKYKPTSASFSGTSRSR